MQGFVNGRPGSGNGTLPELELAISGNASPGPLPRRDGVRCRQWGTRSRQHMFPVLASCTSGNELAHAGNGSFPAWGAYTSGNNPADAGNGSFPANGDTLPETAQPVPAMVHFLYWGAHTSGNDPADVGVRSYYTDQVLPRSSGGISEDSAAPTRDTIASKQQISLLPRNLTFRLFYGCT